MLYIYLYEALKTLPSRDDDSVDLLPGSALFLLEINKNTQTCHSRVPLYSNMSSDDSLLYDYVGFPLPAKVAGGEIVFFFVVESSNYIPMDGNRNLALFPGQLIGASICGSRRGA